MKRPRILMFMFLFALIPGGSVGIGGETHSGVIAESGKAPAGRSMTPLPGERLSLQVAETATGMGSGNTTAGQERSIIRRPERVRAISTVILSTSDWHAWLNKMPPGPASFHVNGTVTVSSLGYDVRLVPSVPQGSNPQELLLDLKATRRAGTWPRQATPMSVRYDVPNIAASYTTVRIRWPGGTPVSLQVEQVF
ncbi:MAG: hypothetical protein HY661_05645 [Betaproteobacteria bacterium]|nr:hypothetical protein [Betaproteobacteria bacterium]